MKQAIDSAMDGINAGEGGPFGAAIVYHGEVLSVTHNTVLYHRDSTAHAEINAIREASKKIGRDLSKCEIYSTTEPCLMCFSAIHWAGIKKIIFGTRVEDVAKLGFREIDLSDKSVNFLANLGIEIVSGFMEKECKELLKYYEHTGGQRY